MFNIFVTVDEHQRFKSLSVKRHLSGLNIHPAMLKIRLLVISKLLTISLTICKPLASIALCNFLFEMK